MNRQKIKTITRSAMLSAFAIAASFLETLLPVTGFLPAGMKIGFSNVAVMLAAKNISFSYGFAVNVIKSIFVLITRGFTAFVLSLLGGLASATVTVIIIRAKTNRFGCIGMGMAGAAAHNTAQVCVYALIVGNAIFYYLPALLIFGIASGILTGTAFFTAQALIMKNK